MKKVETINNRFLLFLKQFKVDEIKLLMNFLELVVHEYKNNSLKLFEILNNSQYDYNNEKILNEIDFNMPKISKVESLSALCENINNNSESPPTTEGQTKKLQVYFHKKTARSPSAVSKTKVNEEVKLNDRDDDEKAAINVLARLSDTLQSSNTDKSSKAKKIQLFKSNFSRVSSVFVNHSLLANDSECDEEDGDYENDCLGANQINNGEEDEEEDWSNYGILSTMTDDEDDMNEEDDDINGTMNDEDDETFNNYDDSNMNNNTMNSNYDDCGGNGNTKKKKASTENIRNSNGRIRKFSDHIRMELEKNFQKNRYISGDDKKILADKLNLTVRQVQKWFVHRREKFRRFEKHHGKKQFNSNNDKTQQQDMPDEEDEVLDEDLDDSKVKEEKVEFNDDDEDDDEEEKDFDDTLPLETTDAENEKHQQTQESTTEEQENNKNHNGYRKYTPYIENYLEKLFRKKHQLTQRDLKSACLNLNLKPKQIRLWFQHRRIKHRQQLQEEHRQIINDKNNKKKISFSNLSNNEEDGDIDLNKRQNYPENVLR